MTDENREPEEWAIVEIFGRIKRAGRISEETRFGAALLRIDIPVGESGEDFVTEYRGGSAIFALRPTTEDVARTVAASLGDPRPVHRLHYQNSLPAPDSDMFDEADVDESELSTW